MKVASGFAEMFEWADGNPNNEDRTGLSVVIDRGDLIRPAVPGETPVGVVGGDNTSVAAISNASPDEWHGKHKRDQFGRLLWEKQVMVEWIVDGFRHWYEADRLPEGVVIPDNATYYYELGGWPLRREILTEEYKQHHGSLPAYVPRWERQEWAIVVLLGRTTIRNGQPVNPNWIKLNKQGETPDAESASEWLIR